MPFDRDRLVRWGLGITGAGMLGLGSGLALAHFTVQGTSQFYMPRATDTQTGVSDTGDSATAIAANHDDNLWQLLPNAGKITRPNSGPVVQSDGFGSSPN